MRSAERSLGAAELWGRLATCGGLATGCHPAPLPYSLTESEIRSSVSRAASRVVESFSWSPVSRGIAAKCSRPARAERKERSALARARAGGSATNSPAGRINGLDGDFRYAVAVFTGP